MAAGTRCVFPQAQICCGQPAFNAGPPPPRGGSRARSSGVLAEMRLSSSPFGLVRDDGRAPPAELLDVEPYEVRELSAFLAGSAPPARERGRTVAYHDSCHMLRELGVDGEPRALLEASGATVVPLRRPDLCCGFGGTFSVRQPEVSVAMADDKLGDAAGRRRRRS